MACISVRRIAVGAAVLLALLAGPGRALAQSVYPPIGFLGNPGEGQFDRPPSFETPQEEQARGVLSLIMPAFFFVDPPLGTLPGTPPYYPFLQRQVDCSLSRFIVDSNNSIVDSGTQYQNLLHSMAGLATTPNTFAGGCTDPMTGIASQIGAFVGNAPNGDPMFALISPDGMQVITEDKVNGPVIQDYPTGALSGSIPALAAADVNHDGFIDIVVASQTGATSGSLTVFLADGTGGFMSPGAGQILTVNMPVAGSTLGVTIDDLRGNGTLDLIGVTASDGTNSGIHVFLGDGTGNFGADLAGPATAGGQVAVTADFNGDGKKDIATSYGNILLGNGTGHFTAAAQTIPVSHLGGLTAADLNGDKKVDLAFTNTAASTVDVYFGNGDGTFAYSASYPTMAGAQSIEATDLDGDGNIDLFIGTAHGGFYYSDFNTQGMFASLMNAGNGTFQLSQAYLPSAYASTNFQGTATYYDVADFDGDAKPDILTFDFESTGASLSVLKGNGDGTFNRTGILTPITEFTAAGSLTQLITADVNGDNKADAIFVWVPAGGGSTISVALGNGAGTFAAPKDYTSLLQIVTAQLVDINGDNKPDIVFIAQTGAATTSTGLYVMLNKGDGTFAGATPIDAEANMGYLAVADVNGDNHADIVVTTTGDQTTTPATPGTVFVYLGNGNGTFQPNSQLSVGSVLPGPVAIADVNGDGRPDIVVAGTITDLTCMPPLVCGTLTSLLGNGNGTFQAPQTTPQPNGFPTALLLADLNGDSKLDAVLGGCCGAVFNYVAPGNGDGTFATVDSDAATHLYLGGDAHRLKLIDINGDGYPDLLDVSDLSAIDVFVSTSAKTFAPSATALKSSGSTVLTGQSVTLTATVTAQSGTGVPTGTVNFLDGTTSIGSVAVGISGVAALSTSALVVGAHSITAAYQGDPYFAATTSSAVQVQVNNATPVATTTTLSPSANPISIGQSVTFTATVVPQSGGGFPTGSVNFLDGSSVIGNGVLNGTGVATFSTSTLAAGTHPITAVYQGDMNFLTSTSSAAQVQVNLFATTTALMASASTTNFGQLVTFTATVTPQSGNGTLTGSVNFLDGATVIGSGPLSSGVGTFSTSSLAVGGHTITAAYQGDATFAGSTSSSTQVQVNNSSLPATTTTLMSSASTIFANQQITFTATVAPQTGTGTPTGTVNFLDGSTLLASSTLNGSDVAMLTTAALTVGTHTITATYQGNASFAASTSSAVQVQVNPAPDFSISATPTSQSVSPGGGASYTLTLGAVNGFNQAVTISCMVLPPGPGCTPATSPVTVSGTTSTTVKVNVTTKAGWIAVRWQPTAPWMAFGFLMAVSAFYLFAFEQFRRHSVRRAYRLAYWAGAVLIAMYISGCTPYPNKTGSGTPAGTYTVTITGTAGNTSHSTTASLTVQ